MLSRTLDVLQSLLFPWHRNHYLAPPPRPPRAPARPSKKRRTSLWALDVESPESLPPIRRLSHSLEDLNIDVFQLIGDQLHSQGFSLQNLALASRKLRSLCFPILFRRCKVDIRKEERHETPEAIRGYVRHLTLLGPLDNEGDLAYVENLLRQFPCLTSIAFEEVHGRIPWAVLQACLVLPNLVSLSIHNGQYGIPVPLFPPDDVASSQIPVSLRRFSYAITTWRENFNGFEYVNRSLSPKDMRPDYDFERDCLSGIVSRLNKSVISLALPMESAPIIAMAALPWPYLRDLSLYGRFIDSVHASSLQDLLPSLSSLRKLSILAGRFPHGPLRYHILPSSSSLPSAPAQRASTPQPSSSSSAESLPTSLTAASSTIHPNLSARDMSSTALLSELRSLAIAYPDPEDGIFSLNLPNLTHLSLRDQPRVYHGLTADGVPVADGPGGGSWIAPLLWPEECLSILRRMDLSHLTSFELVYMAHQPGEDDRLLSYIVESLPRLEHLELHRYRGITLQMRKTRVDHMRIARILSNSSSLVTLRLNLDFHDDHQAYCMKLRERERWFPVFKTRGFEIVDFLQTSCPHLEHVALLYHGRPAATWAEFRPQRFAEPRFVLDYTKDRVDSEPCPKEWVLLDEPVIRLPELWTPF